MVLGYPPTASAARRPASTFDAVRGRGLSTGPSGAERGQAEHVGDIAAIGCQRSRSAGVLPGTRTLLWFLVVGIVGLLVLRILVNRAAQEEISSIVSLNPELMMARGPRTSTQGLKCLRCEQVAPRH